MSLKEEDRQVMVTLAMERVEKTLYEMEVLRKNDLWSLVANRLYYALFHAVSALLVNDRHEVGTHRGAVGKFSLFYVKPGIFTAAEGRMYSQLQKLREDGDYNCSIDVVQEDVERFIEPTRLLIEKIKKYISAKNNLMV
ncbi:MAG: HEPN domain-containing protein [Prevotella sp.]|nr:HEPN domain-containing protein [Prevotella sp.]